MNLLTTFISAFYDVKKKLFNWIFFFVNVQNIVNFSFISANKLSAMMVVTWTIWGNCTFKYKISTNYNQYYAVLVEIF